MKRAAVAMSVALATAALAVLASAGSVLAQTYPNRTIRIVVPYAPGGGVSVLGQIIGTKLSEIVKQPVVIDNRPGAGGNLGADLVAKSPPDGYTLLLHTSAQASAQSLYRTLPFDPVKDFAPVTMVIATQFVIAGSLKTPAATLRELIALAKEKPGALNYGSSGPGSSLHLFAEMFNSAAGTNIVHIPYRGDAPHDHSLDQRRHPACVPAAGDRPCQRPGQPDPRRWRSPERSGWSRSPTCRPPWSRASRASKAAAGTRCSRRPARPRRSCSRSSRPWQRCWPIHRCASGWCRSARSRSATRRPNSMLNSRPRLPSSPGSSSRRKFPKLD